MIICVCFGVSESEIRALMPCSLEVVMRQTDAGLNCGTCLEELKALIAQEPLKTDVGKSKCNR